MSTVIKNSQNIQNIIISSSYNSKLEDQKRPERVDEMHGDGDNP